MVQIIDEKVIAQSIHNEITQDVFYLSNKYGKVFNILFLTHKNLNYYHKLFNFLLV